MSFAPGSLVKARGRGWVVLPGSDDDLVRVRPLGGTDDEVTGILTAVEEVLPDTFDWPDPTKPGDQRSARLLREALRLGFRSGAGPFRSFASIAVEPRPYQLLPLLMSLRQDTIRLLLADFTGCGKTIEAGLIAAEALASGVVSRLAVLCPPHLAEQWQGELEEKFHIPAELVLPSTAPRLERGCAIDQTLFDLHPFVIVSTDYIKAERRRNEFLRTCPEFVIVDEAHTCADDGSGRGGRHQRHDLLEGLAANRDRHIVLVTATPHSGNEGAFRSLLGLLDRGLSELPSDLSGAENEPQRRRLAQHLVQRSRGDVADYLDEHTPFPRREDSEATYNLHPQYRELFSRALAYARETVSDESGGAHHQRVRWWSALALLRSLASSPAAAAATLRARADTALAGTAEEVEAIGRRTLLDAGEDENNEGFDVVPGAIPDEGDDPLDESAAGRRRRRLLEMARMADDLAGDTDLKLQQATELVLELVAEGFNPIVFCRFIPTAEYVAEQLRKALPDDVGVAAITGKVPHTERDVLLLDLAGASRRVLVATDCLSEGKNLQEHFDAVLHYDLAWSPTKHQQREGRVDRFAQASELVRVITYYGIDTQIDGIVLDVLLRKHERIEKSLGVAVPVPAESSEVLEAIFEGLLLRGKNWRPDQPTLFDSIDEAEPRRAALHSAWEDAAERERRSRSLFAQHSIRTDEVTAELAAARAAVGSADDVARFVRTAVEAHGGAVVDGPDGSVTINLRDTPVALRDAVAAAGPLRVAIEADGRLKARFSLPVRDDDHYLPRTHPFVEGLASFVLTSALDDLVDSPARRSGAIRTNAVSTRTTLLLVRYRFDLASQTLTGERVLLAEDVGMVAFEGAPESPNWLSPEAVDALLTATPTGNVLAEHATRFLSAVVDAAPSLTEHLDLEAWHRAEELLEIHRRVRAQARARGLRYRVSAHTPADVLGTYILLPAGGAP